MDVSDPLPPLSEAQLEVMNVVWDLGQATVAEVWKALAPGRKVSRNTVLTTLTRLVEKGWLVVDTLEHAHRYWPGVPREATLRSIVSRLVDTAFAGSVEGLVMALLDGRKVSSAEADRIRKLIQNAEARKR